MFSVPPRIAALVTLSVAFAHGISEGAARGDDDQKSGKTVSMVVDYGDGVQKHFTSLAWSDGMTVLDAVKTAAKHPRGIKIKYRGKGATTFLTKIDDLENEGRTRNWIYRVNNKLADRSFGVFTLKPGDTILWKFGEYR